MRRSGFCGVFACVVLAVLSSAVTAGESSLEHRKAVQAQQRADAGSTESQDEQLAAEEGEVGEDEADAGAYASDDEAADYDELGDAADEDDEGASEEDE